VERIYAKHATSHLSMERNFSEPLHGGHISTADIHDNSESPYHFSIDLHTLQEAKNFSEKQKDLGMALALLRIASMFDSRYALALLRIASVFIVRMHLLSG